MLPGDLAAIEAQAGCTYDAVTGGRPGNRACPLPARLPAARKRIGCRLFFVVQFLRKFRLLAKS